MEETLRWWPCLSLLSMMRMLPHYDNARPSSRFPASWVHAAGKPTASKWECLKCWQKPRPEIRFDGCSTLAFVAPSPQRRLCLRSSRFQKFGSATSAPSSLYHDCLLPPNPPFNQQQARVSVKGSSVSKPFIPGFTKGSLHRPVPRNNSASRHHWM